MDEEAKSEWFRLENLVPGPPVDTGPATSAPGALGAPRPGRKVWLERLQIYKITTN